MSIKYKLTNATKDNLDKIIQITMLTAKYRLLGMLHKKSVEQALRDYICGKRVSKSELRLLSGGYSDNYVFLEDSIHINDIRALIEEI